jgi:hypothetical protein
MLKGSANAPFEIGGFQEPLRDLKISLAELIEASVVYL